MDTEFETYQLEFLVYPQYPKYPQNNVKKKIQRKGYEEEWSYCKQLPALEEVIQIFNTRTVQKVEPSTKYEDYIVLEKRILV